MRAARGGTFQALTSLSVDLRYTAEIRSTLDDSHPEFNDQASYWHNGYFVAVIERR